MLRTFRAARITKSVVVAAPRNAAPASVDEWSVIP
jgi:hypothetical protein